MTALLAVSSTDTVPLIGMPVRGSTATGNMPSVTSVGPERAPVAQKLYTLEPSADTTVV